MTISLLLVLMLVCVVCINTLGHRVNTLNDAIDYLSDCFYLAESDIKSKLPNKEKKLFYYSESGELTRAHDTRYRDWETDRKSTRLNSSHSAKSRMPSSA